MDAFFICPRPKGIARQYSSVTVWMHSAFIQASKEISDLETEPSSIRSLLSTQAILVHDLTKEDVHIDSLFDFLPDSASNSSSIDEISEPSEIENWLTVSNIVDNSLAFLRNSQEIDIPVEHYFDKL